MQSGSDAHEPQSDTMPSRPPTRLWQALALTGMVVGSAGLLSSCILATEDPLLEPEPPPYSQRYARGPEERMSTPPPRSQRYSRSPEERMTPPPPPPRYQRYSRVQEERLPDPGPPPRRPAHSHDDVDIPAGHFPPPGACRIWFPDRQPGRQPPPGDCNVLRRQVPPGATLVYGRQ